MSSAKVTFKGNPVTIKGSALSEGDTIPDFRLTATDMSDVDFNTFKDKVLILSVVPSLDTPVCSTQTKRFNQEASALSDDIAILTISLDLPFAQKRWCGAEGVEQVITASDYKYRNFGEAFGCYIEELGLLARAIFVVDTNGKLVHVEYVPEIGQEPDYESAIAAAKKVVA